MAQKGGKHRRGGKKVKSQVPRHPRELMYRAAFARLLRDPRMEAGDMTQQKLAEKSGYTFADYQRWCVAFAKLHGNKQARDVTRLDAQQFKQHLLTAT